MSEVESDPNFENIVGQELVTYAQLKKIREYLIAKLAYRSPRVSKRIIHHNNKAYMLTIRLEEVKPKIEVPEGVPEPESATTQTAEAKSGE
ncbi:MAG: hypothetical protein QXY08_01525 [Nitrososphaerales archaeon]